MTAPAGWPAPARLNVGLISAGRVGVAVGAALERSGHVVSRAVAPSSAAQARLGRLLPDTDVASLQAVAGGSELLIVAVPDTALVGVIADIAQWVRPATIVAHTAGAHGVDILRPVTARGALPLALHPAMTFTDSDDDTQRLSECGFGITAADETGYAVAQALVLEMGGQPVRVAEANRTLYHAGLAHGANHLVALVADAVATVAGAIGGPDFPGQAPERGAAEVLLGPLLQTALDNALRDGAAALTGPVARGDAAAVAAHLAAIDELDTGIAAGYRALAARAVTQRDGGPALRAVLGMEES